MSGGLGVRERLHHQLVLPVLCRFSTLKYCTAAAPLTRTGMHLTAWWSIVAPGVLSGQQCKGMRELRSATISAKSSEGDATSFDDDGKACIFNRKVSVINRLSRDRGWLVSLFGCSRGCTCFLP